MSTLSRLQGLIGELHALVGSEDEVAIAALAMRAGSLFGEQEEAAVQNAEQWG